MNAFIWREKQKHANFPMERPSPKGFTIFCLKAPLLNLTNPLKSTASQRPGRSFALHMLMSGFRSPFTWNCFGCSSSLQPPRLGQQPPSILPYSAPSNALKPSIPDQKCSHKSKCDYQFLVFFLMF